MAVIGPGIVFMMITLVRWIDYGSNIIWIYPDKMECKKNVTRILANRTEWKNTTVEQICFKLYRNENEEVIL